MLARHLPPSHIHRATHLVLPYLQKFHTSRRNNNEDDSEPILTWGHQNQLGYFYADDYDYDLNRPSYSQPIKRQKIKVQLDPTLQWHSGQRKSDTGTNTTDQAPYTIDLNPNLRWLTASKSILEPQLAWNSGLVDGIEALLEEQNKFVRRLQSGPSDSKNGLVRRYISEGGGLTRRVEGIIQDTGSEFLVEPEIENLETQQERLDREKLRQKWEALKLREALKKEQKVSRIGKEAQGKFREQRLQSEPQELGNDREVLEALEDIQNEREVLEINQQAEVGKPIRLESKREAAKRQIKVAKLRRLWKIIGSEEKTFEQQRGIRKLVESELEILSNREAPKVRRLEIGKRGVPKVRRLEILVKRWTPKFRRIQIVGETLETQQNQQKDILTRGVHPLIRRKIHPLPGRGIYRQNVPIFFRSEAERKAFERPGAKYDWELIRYALVARRYTPHRRGPKIRFFKSKIRNVNELKIRGIRFEPQEASKGQSTINSSTERVEECIKDTISKSMDVGGDTEKAVLGISMEAEGEAVPNDTGLPVNESSDGTVPDEITLMTGEDDGGAVPHESNTVTTEKRQHDLKRTNPNLEDLVGSYQKVPPPHHPWMTGDNKFWRVEPKSGKKRKILKKAKEGSTEIVLDHDVENLLSSLNIWQEEDTPLPELPEVDSEIRLTVSEISSMGDGLAVHKNRVYTVPFGVPGDQVNATVRRHNENHSIAKITSVVAPSPNRDDSLVKCKYFGTCSGCQFQMLPYATQLEHKRKVVQKAFKNFSNLPPELLPEVGETMSSPLEYGYRTKLTPHFNGPRRGGFKPDMPTPNIGFFAKDPRFNMDIEDCPIGTDAVRRGMKEQRAFVDQNLATAFKRGATLLLRESTIRTYLEDAGDMGLDGQLKEDGKTYFEKKLCITNNNARSIEYIGDLKFDNPAGSFFQNNNSILFKFTSYIRENLNLPVIKKAEGSDEVIETTERPKYLVDAYCGSGLFSITCGQGLERVWGIDVDKSSIASARKNALENKIENASFMDSPAEDIFGKLKFPGSETSLIIDPPKKGCDKRFLDQLLDFAPKRVVYVSCNVHTQARDIGYILTDKRGKDYRIDSIRGCDFFPQTHHVEGVVVMTKLG